MSPFDKKDVGLTLQRHFGALAKFSHVESRFCGRKRRGKGAFDAPLSPCVRSACSTTVAVGLCRAGVCRPKAEAGREFLGALQRSFALFETGTVIPELIFKSRIALDRLPTAGTFFPLECIAELHHASSSLWLSLAPRRGRGALVSRGPRERRPHTRPTAWVRSWWPRCRMPQTRAPTPGRTQAPLSLQIAPG